MQEQDLSTAKTRAGEGAVVERWDRRAAVRLDLKYAVRVLLTEGGLGVSGATVNISSGGALIQAAGVLRKGASYRLFVAAPDGIWETRAKVLRELTGHRYALAFETPLALPEPLAGV